MFSLIRLVDRFVAAKGKYVKASGLGGIAMYETGGDYQGALIQAISAAMA